MGLPASTTLDEETSTQYEGVGVGPAAKATARINKMDNNFGVTIWQRNYYDHIIHDKTGYERISNYIKNNPKNW